MNDSLRSFIFWLLIMCSPLVAIIAAKHFTSVRPLAVALALIAAIGTAFYVRAGRSNR